MAIKNFQELVGEVKRNIKEVDVATVKAKLDKGEEVVLIDVREPDEVAAGRLPGATPISRGMLELEIEDAVADPDKEIILYCGGGSRSALAAESLQRMGYRNVYSMAGGFRGWKTAGNRTEA